MATVRAWPRSAQGKPSTGIIAGGTAPALETGVERVGRAVEDGGQLMVCLLSREVAAQQIKYS